MSGAILPIPEMPKWLVKFIRWILGRSRWCKYCRYYHKISCPKKTFISGSPIYPNANSTCENWRQG